MELKKECSKSLMPQVLWSDDWYVYNTGVWERQTLDGLISLLYRTTGEIFTTANIRQLKGEVYSPADMVTPKNTLCLQDCIYNLLTGAVTDHDPEYHHTVKLPFKAPNLSEAPPPTKWINFLKSSGMDNSEIKYLQQFVGYCLTPETAIQKALLLIGPTETGKDVLCEILEAVFGGLAFSGGGLRRFLKGKISNLLLGRTVFLSPENEPGRSLPFSVGIVISGGSVRVGGWGKSAQKVLSGKIIAGTVGYFPGFRRGQHRWDIIKLKREPGSKNNLFLCDEIVDEELQAIFDWSCRGLLDLVKNNYALPVTDRQEKYRETYVRGHPLRKRKAQAVSKSENQP